MAVTFNHIVKLFMCFFLQQGFILKMCLAKRTFDAFIIWSMTKTELVSHLNSCSDSESALRILFTDMGMSEWRPEDRLGESTADAGWSMARPTASLLYNPRGQQGCCLPD